MIKRVVIGAAGNGTRMLHLTNNKPKHLIKVKEKPFLAYLLDNLLEAGLKDIIVVAGYKGEMVKEFLENYKPPRSFKGKYETTIVNQFEILGKKEYGTACVLKCLKDFFKNKKEDFLMIYGDNFYSVKDLKIAAKGGEYNYVVGLFHKHPEKYGVLICDEKGFLKKIVERPEKHVGNLINTGLYKFNPEVFDKLSEIKKSSRGEYEITDAITLLAKEGKVQVREIKDYWLDFGNPGDIIRFNRFLKNSKI